MISAAFRSTAIATAVTLAALAATGASASTIDDGSARSMVVRHGDLDLTSDHGVGLLNRRIAVAARSVCGAFNPVDLPARERALTCRRASIAAAAPKAELAVAAAREGQQLASNSITVGNAIP